MGSSTVTGLRKSGSEASGSHALSDQPRRKIDSASIGFVWGYDNEDMDTSDSVWGTESTENTYLQSMGSYSSGRSLDCGYGMFHGDTDDGKAGNSTELQSRTTTSKTLPVNTKGGAHGAATLEKSIPVKDSRKVEPRAERDRNRRSRRRKTRNAAGKYNVGALQGNHEAV
ncbi:hypothetical protein K435DRAFT_781271 [Dendrothele bispora CBS 962.96]|uniref:Uncharacterized protein n=1 Tax=Dendrothele bispora (strain CBS 962.96) TaxID=1314807 RepID=A0A4V4HEA6_DENBC|nr:hypothetical protein K435DRAFT_781271 [Dendrothele bispora CBS 962.96]